MATLTLKKKPAPTPHIAQPVARFKFDPTNPTKTRDHFARLLATLPKDQRKAYHTLRAWDAHASREQSAHRRATKTDATP